MCRESECAPDKLTESVNQSGAGCGSGLWVWG